MEGVTTSNIGSENSCLNVEVAVLATLLYLRIRPIIDSVKATTKTVENISYCVEEEVVKPISKVAALIQGIQGAIGRVGRFKQKREDD